MPIPLIIDTDPGLDDALAILLALKSPELDVRALTVVAGNCPVEQGTLNARKVLHAAGRCDVPVASGAAGPLLRERLPGWVGHGPDGLGEIDVPGCEAEAHRWNAVRFLIETLSNAPEPVTLVPVGPLTNVALALAAAPEMKGGIRELIIMGGAVFCPGNRTPAAEFNILSDPESAKMVFASGVPITLVGLDVTERVMLKEAHVRRLERARSPAADFAARAVRYVMPHSLARYGDACMHLHDPLAVGVAIDRSLVRTQSLYVDVETAGGITLGKTLADPQGRFGKEPNVAVGVEVDAERFVEMMVGRLAKNGIG